MSKKCLMILLDGLGDRSYEIFGHKTPLQAAVTPMMDRLAALGANGLYHASQVGLALPSENAHFAMFGYDLNDFPGRGALVALGSGAPFSSGDVGVLANFAEVVSKDGVFVMGEEKPSGTPEQLDELTEVIRRYETDGVTFRFYRFAGIKGILILGGEVSRHITDCNHMINGLALSDIVPWQSHREDRTAIHTACMLKKYLLWVHRNLKDHRINIHRKEKNLPAMNFLITQRAGKLKTVMSFSKRFGLRGMTMASDIVFAGLGKYLGLDFRRVSDSDNPGKDLEIRLGLARQLLETYDFIHVHTKAPDEAAHKKDPELKRKTIESLDKGLSRVEAMLDDPDILIVLATDHSTPSAGPLIHSGEPVPVVFCGKGVRRDNVARYDEVSAAPGALGTVRGPEMMYLILNHLDKSKLMGTMHTPIDQFHWPGDFNPFSAGSD